MEDRFHHCGVPLIALLGAGEINDLDIEKSRLRRIAIHQRVENGIAVKARPAHPVDLAARIHQGRNRAIADQRMVKPAHAVASASSLCSQACSEATSGVHQAARVGRRSPTRRETPPSRLTTAKPSSSVVSSPAKIGVLPAKAGSAINASIAVPLLAPAGLISRTFFPS